jgi:hypothetical protein
MFRQLLVGAALLLGVSVIPALAQKAPPSKNPPASQPASAPEKNCEMTLEDFMKKRLQATIKDKTLTKEQVEARLAAYFKELETLAPDPKWNEGAKSWKKITATAAEKKTFGTSCKTCHTAFEKKYQATYKANKICVDSTLP